MAERKDRVEAACAAVAEEGVELPGRARTVQLAHAAALLSQDAALETARYRLEALIRGLPPEPVETTALLADARATGLNDECADFAVTSPPYINVFNYHQVGRPLSDAFGWPVLAAARSEIGSNRQNRGNRFRTVVQYSIDMGLMVAELSRLLRDGATAVLVLGRVSRVRGVAFFNGEIVGRLAEQTRAFRQFSKGERFFVNRFGESIVEDILVLGASQHTALSDDEVIDLARTIGVEALEYAVTSEDTASDVTEAIEVASDICPSPKIEAGLDLV